MVGLDVVWLVITVVFDAGKLEESLELPESVAFEVTMSAFPRVGLVLLASLDVEVKSRTVPVAILKL